MRHPRTDLSKMSFDERKMHHLNLEKIRDVKNRERNNRLAREWNHAHREELLHKFRTINYRFSYGKSTAKSCKREWTLTLLQYEQLIVQPCTYCKKSIYNDTGISLDRIDNSRGYSQDNVLPCCGVCNETRNDNWTVEETKAMIKAGLTYREQVQRRQK